MKTLQQQLGTYGLYHRSKRNVLTHFFGIPLIVFAALCLLARIQIPLGSEVIDGAQLFVLASVVYYFMLSISLGFIMGVLFTLLLVAAQSIAAMAFRYSFSPIAISNKVINNVKVKFTFICAYREIAGIYSHNLQSFNNKI